MDIANLTLQIPNATNIYGATLNGAPIASGKMIYAAPEAILKFCEDACTANHVMAFELVIYSIVMLFIYLVVSSWHDIVKIKITGDPIEYSYSTSFFYVAFVGNNWIYLLFSISLQIMFLLKNIWQ